MPISSTQVHLAKPLQDHRVEVVVPLFSHHEFCEVRKGVWAEIWFLLIEYECPRDVVIPDRFFDRQPPVAQYGDKFSQPWAYQDPPVAEAVVGVVEFIEVRCQILQEPRVQLAEILEVVENPLLVVPVVIDDFSEVPDEERP